MYSAGILPYAVVRGRVYFLLGEERREQVLSDFGGRSEDADRGSAIATACREFYEETVGSVLAAETVKDIIETSDHFCIRAKTISNCPYFCYVVRIPYDVGYIRAFENNMRFMRWAKFHKKFFEKQGLVWVSLDTLTDNICNRASSLSLRSIFKSTLCNNMDILSKLKKLESCPG